MPYQFGKYSIPDHQVFYEGEHCYAMVNTKPIRPNHLLVCPKRQVKDFSKLRTEELHEMMQIASLISRELGGMCSLAIQDGPDAGQTVEHVHVHIIPRAADRVLQVDSDRQERSEEEMEQEALELRQRLNLAC